MIEKLITVDGGVIRKDDVTLTIGSGCLAEETEITLIKHDQNMNFKSMLFLGLIETPPYVFELLPDGLKFLKPAHLTIRFEATLDSQLCILHRSHEDTVWELAANDIEKNSAKGIARMKINGFSFWSYFMAWGGELARFLSHINNSFSCCAYVFYRRQQTMNRLEISVVLISEFVIRNQETPRQLQYHKNKKYTQGGEGVLKTVHTNLQLEISLQFPGIERPPYSFTVDLPQLDSIGFVVNEFEAVDINGPANGTVEVHEVQRNGEKNILWRLNVCEGVKNTGEEGDY